MPYPNGWTANEAMQGWEAAEEQLSWAKCDLEKWQEMATNLAGCAECLLDLMTSDLRESAVPEVRDAIAFLESAVAKVRVAESKPRGG